MALTIAGCGGTNSAGSLNPNRVFEGTYISSFTNSGANTDSGEFAINVSASGVITGRFIDVTNKTTSSVNGQITLTSSTLTSDTGTVTLTSSGQTETGTFTLSSGVLTGSAVNSGNGLTVNFTSGLISTASGNTFAGFYTGTFTVNGVAGSPANPVTFIIDGSGNITALATDNIIGQTGTSTFTGTIVTVTGVATFPAGIGQTTTGTLTLTGGVLSGSVNNISQTNLISYTLNQNT